MAELGPGPGTGAGRPAPAVSIEYCGVCEYGGRCLELAKLINATTPNAAVVCRRGRQGSFEISINDKLIYSKLKTMALPDYEEVNDVVKEAAAGGEIKEIKKQQPIDCAVS